MADKDDVKELRGYVNEQRYKEAKGQRAVAGVIGGIAHPLPLGGIYPAVKAKPGRKAAVFGRATGRSFGEGLAGMAPGVALIAAGAKTRNPGLLSAGRVASMGGSIGGGYHGAYAATKNAQLRGDIKKGAGMYSAFGVNHGEEIAKFSLKPVQAGFKALRFGKAPSTPKVMGRSYKAGIKSGKTRVESGIQAMKTGFQHSPGTALAAGGLATGGAGAVGYGIGRRKD